MYPRASRRFRRAKDQLVVTEAKIFLDNRIFRSSQTVTIPPKGKSGKGNVCLGIQIYGTKNLLDNWAILSAQLLSRYGHNCWALLLYADREGVGEGLVQTQGA